MGFEAFEEEIRGDFEENIRDKEDDEGSVVFIATEAEIFGEAVDIGVCNVDAIRSAEN